MGLLRLPREERADSVTLEERARFDGFAGGLTSLGRRPKTLDSYRSDWLGFAVWWNGSRGAPFDARHLDGGSARQYKAHLVGARMTPATVNRKLVFLKRYADWLRE